MSDERNPLTDIFENREVLLGLREAIDQKIVYSSGQEQLRVESLSHRAIQPGCSFDRKHRLMIYALALAPDQVDWILKLQERILRLFCHH
jgi:hypothetical protein